MSLSFPPSAINGQVYQGWVFDGEKWNPNWASLFVTSVNNKSGALMPADVVGAGNRVLLSIKTTTASVASIDTFYDFSQTTYDQYEIDIYDLQTSADADNMFMRISTDGSTFLSDGNYQYGLVYVNDAGTVQGSGYNVGSGMGFGAANSAANGYLTECRIFTSMLWTTDRVKYWRFETVTSVGASVIHYNGGGLYAGATYKQPFKGFSIFPQSGTITRGVVALYGLVKPSPGGN